MIRACHLSLDMVGAVWVAFSWAYGGVLASKNGQIELQDRQLADYPDKLTGATPEEAKAKIDAREDKVRNTIGDRWEGFDQKTKATNSFH